MSVQALTVCKTRWEHVDIFHETGKGMGASLPQDDWETVTIRLIESVLEERQRTVQRKRLAERRVAELDRKAEALNLALNTYRESLGLPPMSVSPRTASDYEGLSAKAMLRRWASTHGGYVVMKEACRFLAAAGAFDSERQAAGTLYPTVARVAEFRRIERGVYANDAQDKFVIAFRPQLVAGT